jgi:hypothetical protein
MIAGANDDGSVYLWSSEAWATDVARLASSVCSSLGRYLTPADWTKYVGGEQNVCRR